MGYASPADYAALVLTNSGGSNDCLKRITTFLIAVGKVTDIYNTRELSVGGEPGGGALLHVKAWGFDLLESCWSFEWLSTFTQCSRHSNAKA